MRLASCFLLACAAALFSAMEAAAQPAMGGAIAAIDEPAESAGGGPPGTPAPRRTTSSTTIGPKPRRIAQATVRRKHAAWRGPVIGDKYTFLNFEVVSAEKPYYTRAAKASGARGLVQVEVLIDTSGSVLSARARTGDPLLHPEAERAALASKFNKPFINGRPARAIGFLVYRFGPAED
jgi:outer membrane biosynthesis protein TonB